MNQLNVHQADREITDASRARDRLNRALRLLRSVRAAADAGDPIPALALLAERTGLPDPGPVAPSAGLNQLIAAAEAERAVLQRRLRMVRALQATAPPPEEDTEEMALPTSRIPTPAAPHAAPVSPPISAPAPSAPAPSAPAPLPLVTSSVPAALEGEVDRLAKISARDLDRLPYGAIVLDHQGRVVAYNDTESRMARLPVEAVVGRNFFTEVAPCTRVQAFEGRFRQLAAGSGPQLATFDFVFPFPFGAQKVTVLITSGVVPGTLVMALLRR